MGPWFHIVLMMTIPWVRGAPKCAYELLTLNALSFPLKCCNSAFFVSRDNLQIRDRKTPQIRWLAHLLRICSVFALSTEKRQSDSLGRARLYCDNSQVMALVRFYTAGNQGKTEQCRTRLVPTPGEGARKILVRGNKSQHRINGVSQGSEVFLCQILIKTIFLPESSQATPTFISSHQLGKWLLDSTILQQSKRDNHRTQIKNCLKKAARLDFSKRHQTRSY